MSDWVGVFPMYNMNAFRNKNIYVHMHCLVSIVQALLKLRTGGTVYNVRVHYNY
jgi:hypothetical protein